jgi:ribosomal protein L37AE/L43A
MNSEDRALKNILQGKPVEKKVMVGYTGKKEKTGDVESHLTKIMKEVRTPWFCPKCSKVMKKKLDDKMWRLFGHCFDCQVEFEHKLRANGEYEEWEHQRVVKNKISLIKNDIEELVEWKSNSKTTVVEPVNIDTGFVHTEDYVTPQKYLDEADEAIESLTKKLKEFEDYLEENKIAN